MKKATLAWLELADRDLKAAIKLAEDNYLANLALFHCQQCIEKCMKALLEENGINPPRIHSVHRLWEIVKEDTGTIIPLSEEEMDTIDNIYTDTRYPGNLGLLPSGFPSQDLATEIIKVANKVLDFTSKAIQKSET